MRVYIYCTKAKPNIVKGLDNKFYISNAFKEEGIDDYKLNGKIVAYFDLNKVEKMGIDSNNGLVFNCGFNEESQLSLEEIVNYVGDNYYYAWHIDNLQVFGKPMELSEFEIKKAPQSWCYTTKYYYGIEADIPIKSEGIIIISIKPEWVEKILNGKKTIEVRKTCPRKFR